MEAFCDGNRIDVVTAAQHADDVRIDILNLHFARHICSGSWNAKTNTTVNAIVHDNEQKISASHEHPFPPKAKSPCEREFRLRVIHPIP